MQTVNDVAKKLGQIAPERFAESYDNVGLIIGDETAYVTKALVCHDVTLDVVEEAKKMGANLIVTYHPIIFNPIKKLTYKSDRVAFECMKNDISVIAAHTNFDVCDGGINDVMCAVLGLQNIKPLQKIPGENVGYGRIGQLPDFMSPADFASFVKRAFNAQGIRYVPGGRKVKTVAVVGGSGGSFMDDVLAVNADAFVTGDLKHNLFISAYTHRLTLIDAGHYATEAPGVMMLCERLSRCFDDLAFRLAEASVEKVRYL